VVHHPQERQMHDDKLDPRPVPDQFARAIAARAAAMGSGGGPLNWLRGWHDREGTWTNLRNIEHWIERAGA
jgi:hypothetical protein